MSVLIDYSSGAFEANKAQGVGTVTDLGGDADFSKVTLLMHMDGSNGSTTFTDSTSNNHPTTASGNAQVSTTQSKFGGASAYFDGVGDYVTVNSGSAAYVSNQDFTIECWINYTFSGSSETRMIVISGGQQTSTYFDYFQIAVKNNNSLYAEYRVFRGVFSTPANSLTPNTWHHIALVRDSTSTRFYIDGVEEASTTAWAGKILRTQTPATVTLGQMNAETGFDNEYPGEYYKGYIDEVRVTKGLARYTSTFTPPTAAFLGASGPINLDISSGNYFNYTPTANTTFAFGNAPASGTAAGFALAVTGANAAETYDIANASYDSVSFSVASQEANPYGLFFKPDGTKMYITGWSIPLAVAEYDLSTAFDISTASHVQDFGVGSQETNPTGVFFKDDGTKMYVVGQANDNVNEYNLSTAWNISTASYSQNFSVASQETTPRGLYFNNNGTKFFITGSVGDDVNEYSLSTAWDISTASFTTNFSFSSQETNSAALSFNSDGTKMYIIGFTNDTVFEYDLTTGFDVSTASYNSVSFSVASQDTNPSGIAFNSAGTKMYIIGQANDTIYQYTTGSVATATFSYPSSVEWPSGTAPDGPAIGETDVLVFLTDDNGTSYQGFQAGDSMS